ncbi:MAG TPA: GYF domain-containing protein, partial [Polyangiaceae bacterium]|nr:GYF domain-containing protein [Polyangiaceae bacterium]
MSGLHEVDCSGCGRRHVTNGEQARKQRVLRCDCGYFVRLDRALADRRSEPTPPPVEIASVRDDDEDATRMMSSQSAAALIGEGRARSRQPSLVDDERAWRPLDRESAQQAHPSSPAPARPRQHSIAPSEKPLWYVDLGGTELVQMTIEQLILARRGGKLGEGALVWREGMPNWRPVGTLIPAASASAHPAPLPSASSRPAPPAPPPSASSRPAPLASGSSRPAPQPNASTTPTPIRPPVGSAIGTPFPGRVPPARRPPPSNPPPDEGTPRTFASYERPLATLEFALERPEPDRLVRATRSSLPNMDSGASLSRPPTPLPRASLGSVLSTPFPRPGHLPRLTPETTPAPVSPGRRSPPPQPAPLAFASPIPSAAPVRSSDRPNQAALMNLQIADTLSERPRWVSACIALLVCVTASA